jgi:hypothetical protein
MSVGKAEDTHTHTHLDGKWRTTMRWILTFKF